MIINTFFKIIFYVYTFKKIIIIENNIFIKTFHKNVLYMICTFHKLFILTKVVQIWPGGTPPTKIGHFVKNVENSIQHQNTHRGTVLQKTCKISKKHFLTNVTNFQPRGTCCVHLTIFVHYPCCLMIYNKKAIEN